jgi:uncharacterized protein (TIGR02145 family)
MTILRSFLIGIFTVSICVAQPVIFISGTVTDTGGIPISGVIVRLENAGWGTTTQENGNFTIANVGVHGQDNQSLPLKLSAKIHNGLLSINVAEKSTVEITTFDLSGKALSTVQKTIEAGNHSLALPNMGAGIHLYKVKTGSSEFLIKSHSFAGVSGVTAVSVQDPSSNALVKQARVSAAINDVIAVAKDGYLNYRVIVTNSDTSGIEIKMIVCAGTVTDTDGNVYQTVRIGNQIWMAENLRTTKYNDGTIIPHIPGNGEWYDLWTPGYCYYNNTTNTDSIKKFGALYNWHVVNTKKLAPTNWHVPTDTEWDLLENFLMSNGYNYDENTIGIHIAKSMAAKTDWSTNLITDPASVGYDLQKNNRSGFSALPSGIRGWDGIFCYISEYCGWWSTTEFDAANAYALDFSWGSSAVGRTYWGKKNAYSVRLVRNN